MSTVSVIIPVYNVEAYLEECIDSVLHQTFSDFEVILVDDGSPDRCGDICEKYAALDRRIHVIHKENGGLSSARNAGLDIATGKYIYFLDSDDFIEPELLEHVVAKMETGLDLAVFNFYRLYEDGRKEAYCFHEIGSYEIPDEASRADFIMKTVLQGKLGWEAWSRMYVREKIEQYGLRFEDNRKIFAEDLYFHLCYCAHVERLQSIEGCYYNYRIRENSIMGVQKRKNNIARINELSKEVQKYYQKFEDCKLLIENFDVLRMQIIMGQFIPGLWTSGMNPESFREAVWESVSDWQIVKCQLERALNQKGLAQRIGSFADALELKAHMRFLLGGSWTVLRARCKLVRIIRMMQGG